MEKEVFKESRYNVEDLFKMVCGMWPWQEFFPALFKKLKDILNRKHYEKFIINAISKVEINWKFEIPVEQSPAQRRLHQLWLATPSDYKGALVPKIFLNNSGLLKSEDLTSLKLILNDKHVNAHDKQKILEKMYPYLINLVSEGKEKFFVQFVNEIIVSKKWDDNTQEHVKLLYKLILQGEFKLADEVLDCYSDEDKAAIKNEMDPKLICHYFIVKHEYGTADKFFKWKFNDPDEIKKIKTLFDNDFITSHVSYLWNTSKDDVEVAKLRSQNFLFLLLESEMKILGFKQTHLLSKMICYDKEYFRFKFIHWENFEILEDFLSWCSLNASDYMKMIKRNIAERHKKIFHYFGIYMKHNNIEKAEKLLNWLFDSQDEKHNFMSKFLLSENGLVACKFYVGKYFNPSPLNPKLNREDLTNNFKRFIHFFMKPYLKNFDQLKSDLEDWPQVSKTNFVTILKSDDSSCEDLYYEFSDEDDEDDRAYCNLKNYHLFLSLLDGTEEE